ncbi:MAG TPA: anhydro-N-acetylmuramic acid kinase, partial [Tepidisphaeraceae bacterium]|nr:anhydro-N-acetylmuramic acid kinase [Tepidisphaeraceae bacterium]
FDPALRHAIQQIRRSGHVGLAELARIGRQIADAYVRAVRSVCEAHQVAPADLAGVAAHGQTLFHAPPDTIQWLDPAILAHALGCPIISDFRRADLAAGGQGAPLVPFGDLILFRSAERARAIVNIGGIGNVTILPAGATLADVRAFDTGPGNCISDHLCQLTDPTGPGYDAGGQLASSGTVDDGLVEAMLDD